MKSKADYGRRSVTDLITRARKEWLEVHKSPEDAPDGEAWHYTLPCPQDVVAALLDVLASYIRTCDSIECVMPCCQTPAYKPHKGTCPILVAEAALSKALEEK